MYKMIKSNQDKKSMILFFIYANTAFVLEKNAHA